MLRRDLLHLLGRRAAALALASLFGAPGRAEAPAARNAWSDYPFTLGIASGMPRPDSIVLWTRLAPRPHEPGGGLPPLPLTVRWELAEDDGFSIGLRSGTAIARPEHAHSVHVSVGALPAGRVFFYRFHAGDASSPIGRTRTAPGPEAPVERLRFALASCQHYEQGWYAAHREIAARELDFVLFVGDYIYETSKPRERLRAHEGPEPYTLDAYRARHATYKLDPDLRAAHAAHPWLLTWDDHEVENDYAGGTGSDALDAAAFLRRRSAAYKAYFEHLPVTPALPVPGGVYRVHERYAWGRLAELWLLDGRQYRDVQACGGGHSGGRVLSTCSELDDRRRSVFGAEQERWLDNGLGASRARWKLLAQGTQISGSGVDTPFGRRLYSDGWDGYPQARARLLDGIAQRGIHDVLCLGGDVHRHVAADLRARPNDTAWPVVASEFVCSSVTSRGLSDSLTALIRSSNPDIAHARSDERGYVFVEVDERQAHGDFRATPFPAAEGAPLHSQARFAVAAGQAGVLRD